MWSPRIPYVLFVFLTGYDLLYRVRSPELRDYTLPYFSEGVVMLPIAFRRYSMCYNNFPSTLLLSLQYCLLIKGSRPLEGGEKTGRGPEEREHVPVQRFFHAWVGAKLLSCACRVRHAGNCWLSHRFAIRLRPTSDPYDVIADR